VKRALSNLSLLPVAALNAVLIIVALLAGTSKVYLPLLPFEILTTWIEKT
jgi:hypothetical protein